MNYLNLHLEEAKIHNPSTLNHCPTQPQGVLTNVTIDLAGKTMLIDMEVVNAQLDYNIRLGHSYMYVMRAITSIVFRLMMFPHNRNIVTIN